MSAAVGETGRGQKPAIAPRPRMARHASNSGPSAEAEPRSSVQHRRSTSEVLTAPVKTKPARPDPPKFKPEVPPPPSFTKRPLVKKIAVRRPSPPSRELLQSALSHYYGDGVGNGFATAPSRARRKKINNMLHETSTEEAGQNVPKDPTVYLNVAPKTPPSARPTSKNYILKGAGGNTKGSLPTARSSSLTRKVNTFRPSPLKVHVSDSKEAVHKSPTPTSNRLSPLPKHLNSAQKEKIHATHSVPLPDQTQVTNQTVVRQDFTKQPLPKGASMGHVSVAPRQGRAPVRPAPPTPYNQRKKKHSVDVDKEIVEYTYVDPHRYRYPTMEALDLSTHYDLNKTVIYANTSDNSGYIASEVYTALSKSTISEDVYTVPDPPFSKTPPPVVEVSDLSRADREVDRFTDLEGSHAYLRDTGTLRIWLAVPAGHPKHPPFGPLGNSPAYALAPVTVQGTGQPVHPIFKDHLVSDKRPPLFKDLGPDQDDAGHSVPVYANVAPKPPIRRSKSFTLNTSSGLDSLSPTSLHPSHAEGAEFSSPPHNGGSPDLTDGHVYTAITPDTMELPSIYEVPPALK